ncbi:VWA domain-containing protein [Clostridium sp. C8-1-8]|uniref:vWA domain-containing protein n=1 Tax=Clostridium sp. C8-1-8 TaxID=2698831 RepID=UPI00136899FD|nr:VWA domain-containing protein [Clostridium sp. C8-1-8]
MKLYSPMSLWFLLLIPLLILMYILKQKYEEKEIPSLFLWQQVLAETEASTPFEKFRNNLLFFLQLLILLLCIFALASPFIKLGNKNFENVIIVMDNSGSMNALGDKNSRLEEAEKKAEDMVKSLSPDSRITLISSGKSNKVEISSSTDKKEVINKIKNIKQSNSAGDINDTYSLVKSISNSYDSYKVVYYTDSDVNLKDLNGEVVSLSIPRENVSLDYMSQAKDKDYLNVMVRVTNHGKDTTSELLLYGEEKLLDIKNVDIKAGETKTVYFDKVQTKDRFLKCELSQKDGLDADNDIYSIVKQKNGAKVLLSSNQNVFLEKALSTIKDVELFKTNPGEAIEGDYDLYIFDGKLPSTLPKKGNILIVNPDRSNEYFNLSAEKDGGKAEILSHVVTKYMDKSSFVISKVKNIDVPSWGSVIMKAAGSNVAFCGEIKGQKISTIAFDLHNSDMPLTPEFPIFINNLMSYLLDRDTVSGTQYYTGDSIEIVPQPEAEKIWISTPDNEKVELGTKYPLKPFDGAYNPGVYEVHQKIGKNEQTKLIAVNFPTSESDTFKKVASKSVGKGSSEVSKSGMSLSNILLALAVIILLIEWYAYVRIHGK